MTVPSTFILAEDKAIKGLVSGLTVQDFKSHPRAVQTYFGMPDKEMREQAYPFITIDLLDVSEATDGRVMAGYMPLPYTPPGVAAPGANEILEAPYATPYYLTYQVGTWARHPRHDRSMLAQLLGSRIPWRWGQVAVTEDETIRRVDTVGYRKPDFYDPNGKRVFRNVWTLRVASELFFWEIDLVPTAYSGVTINANTSSIPSDYTPV